MGKSQETFSKKEKEKKRLAQRKEKEEKKQERKANTQKGKSLEDMMAYIDENGNLTSTPPDPTKKRVYNSEDIQIGVAKQEDIVDSDVPRVGVVSFFNTTKGFGFIKDNITQESIFVHINQLSSPIKENDKVNFSVEKGAKGPVATNVTVIA